LAESVAAPGLNVGLPALASLALQGAYNFTDAALCELLAAAPALRRLAVPQGSKFGGGFVERLPALLPRLEELDLSGGGRCFRWSFSAVCGETRGLQKANSYCKEGPYSGA
jgi:hypothetical protein